MQITFHERGSILNPTLEGNFPELVETAFFAQELRHETPSLQGLRQGAPLLQLADEFLDHGFMGQPTQFGILCSDCS